MHIFIIFLCLLLNFKIYPDGFTAGTLVKTFNGYTRIENLKPGLPAEALAKAGDWLVSCDFINNNREIGNALEKIQKKQVSKFIRIKAGNEINE